MRIEKNVVIPVSDGTLLRANVYRPKEDGQYPVIMAFGVYGKDVHFADAFKPQWETLTAIYPDIGENGSSGNYLRWETVDPERWVPDGYVVIQVDARGTGMSPGYLDPLSPQETQDYYDAIEWAGIQSWSSGKVGLIGVSYYAINQWQVAALQPPHLAAMIPWEGGCDHYRDWSHHGGIFSNTFLTGWWPRQILVNQHGNSRTTHMDRETGVRTTGEHLSDESLRENRASYPEELFAHPLDDAWHQARTPDLSKIVVPFLSAGNWGGPGVHLRGNIEGFMRASSKEKWLSMHIGTHFESFYLPEFVAMQKRFFGCYLKNEDNGWKKTPPVRLSVRTAKSFQLRYENAFPLARTKYSPMHLNASTLSMETNVPAVASRIAYAPLSEGVSFSTKPFEHETEVTGFITLKLWTSSTSDDLDMFATLRVFDEYDEEIVFTGAHESTPLTRGWLRASHREINERASSIGRVFRPHQQIQKWIPNTIYPLEVEIWPTSFVFTKGHRLVLTLQGKDFEYPGVPGRILHNHPQEREPIGLNAINTIYTGPTHDSYLLLPVIKLSN